MAMYILENKFHINGYFVMSANYFYVFGLQFYSLELFPGFSCRGEGKHQREEEERKKGDGEYDGCVGEAAETPEVTEPKVEPLEKSRRQETQSWLLMNL